MSLNFIRMEMTNLKKKKKNIPLLLKKKFLGKSHFQTKVDSFFVVNVKGTALK